MNCLAVASFLAALAFASAGILVGPSAKIIQGPSSKTTVVGPDGSSISSIAPAGQIITEEHPGVVAHTAPLVAAPVLAHSAVVAHSAPVLTQTVVSHSVPVVSHGLVAQKALDTVVSGPSGVIATTKDVVSPVLISHEVPHVLGVHSLIH